MSFIFTPVNLIRVLAGIVWISLLAAAGSFAQSPSSLIQNVTNRKTISLNGDWHYIADPHEEGTARRYYLNGKLSGTRPFVEYDFNASPTLRVPGDWNVQRPELQLYEGTLWYQKSFDYHAPSNTRVFLYFGAANYHARVLFRKAESERKRSTFCRSFIANMRRRPARLLSSAGGGEWQR